MKLILKHSLCKYNTNRIGKTKFDFNNSRMFINLLKNILNDDIKYTEIYIVPKNVTNINNIIKKEYFTQILILI